AGHSLKFWTPGGSSTPLLTDEHLDVPLDYEGVAGVGSMLGTKALQIFDETTCVVRAVRRWTQFYAHESRGKCTPCREGTYWLAQIYERFVEGEGTPEDLELLEEVAGWVKAASLCGLGQTAPNPVLSTLRYFHDEYEAHVMEKRCPAGVCRALIRLTILPDLCNGCGLCLRECPVDAISGEKKEPHVIDPELCTHCRICYDVCPVGAIEIVR
ncbi:MAG: 4Fe-4S binding protein, partial [Anaerolineae bacterium]|nr:4Fe-4S binding protein [Anaerolineae bacterium]